MTISPGNPSVVYAGLRRRIAAFAFDFLIIGAYIVLLLIAGVSVNAVAHGIPFFGSPIAMNILAFLTLILPVVLYFAIQEASSQQATWGKRRLKIKVVNNQRRRMSLWQSVLRSAVKFLPWQLAHTCVIYLWFGNQSVLFLIGAVVAQGLVIIYLACLWFNKRQQTPYDWLAGTSVIQSE